VRDLLAPTTLAEAPVVRCSAMTGMGLDELRAALDAAIDGLERRRHLGRARLPIDRVFTMTGFGTVVTGTLIDGELRSGDEVEVLPPGHRVRIRGLQSHREKVARALPGMRTAVNLAGIERDTLRRGMVLATPGAHAPTSVFDARVTAVRGAPRPLPHNARLTLHAFTAEAPAQLRLLDRDELVPGGTGWAQLRLGTPVVVARGDRFVLRSPDDTVAGGIVVAIDAPRRRRRDADAILALARLLSDSAEDRIVALLSRAASLSSAEVVVATGLPEAEVRRALETLVAAGAAVRVPEGERVIGASPFAEAAARAMSGLATFHARYPLRPGMPREELRAALGLDARSFDDVLALTPAVVLDGSVARLAAFTPMPTPEQRAVASAWLAALRDGATLPPIDDDLRTYLVRRGDVVDAGNGVLFEATRLQQMREAVQAHVRRCGAITIAEARDMLATNRRRAQALLELMDRLGDTRREGDAHVLRQR
jgi:selenocysteine-specific elongation factor